jgi:hypothetical protein
MSKLGGKVNPKLFARSAAVAGILGVAMIGISFGIVPGPPTGLTGAQLISYGQQNSASVQWGSLLQAAGPVFIMIFAFSIVVLAGVASRLSGILTFFGGVLLTIVSMIEVLFYTGILTGALNGSAAEAQFSLDLVYAVQHFYFGVAAPAVFFPLGFVILKSKVLPKVFGYLALVLGGVFVVLGLAYVYTIALPNTVTDLGVVQAFWWIAAAVYLLVRADKIVSLNDRSASKEVGTSLP